MIIAASLCKRASSKHNSQLEIFKPDFLLDISAVANCFEGYGHHPLLFIVNLLKPRVNTYHTLLGNFAGSALDDIINHTDYQIADTFRSNFREKALEYACCEDFDANAFKRDAARQVQHIQEIVQELFGEKKEGALLEPSFVCPKLGFQGRVDLMTTDFRLLVEQKSGKSICPQKHYVQVLLYAGVLAANFGTRAEQADIRLLYSKFALPDGLRKIHIGNNRHLLDEAITFRNQVVELLYRIADEGFESILPLLTPETLATQATGDTFFQRYELPRLQELLHPLQTLTPLERAYFCRMMTFVIREQIVGKTGGVTDYYRSSADLWRMPLDQKHEMGYIYIGLTIAEKQQSTSYNGYDTITLSVPNQGNDFMPDFRRGDMVYLYAYPADKQPDATKAILYKGVLTEIRTEHITVHLNDGQQNAAVFEDSSYATSNDQQQKTEQKDYFWAVEHASSDVNSNASMSMLYAFITAEQDRKDLLLGQREPRINKTRQLSRSYHPDYDDVLRRAFQAEDYFLLVGPPGTGKTSMALRFMVEEEMNQENSSLLLLSYTNRAVDEICDMLDSAGFDYLRLGSEYSCDPRFAPHLLSATIERMPTVTGLRQQIHDTRIVVCTTSYFSTHPFNKTFSLAIIDEASQILEPNIIGLLANRAINHFILIGDHKQLPAVVQQTESDAAVSDPLLLDIQLNNCRNSLFERLIRTEKAVKRTDFIGILKKQGRMHPDIAAFPCHSFYGTEQLQPVPLQHQRETTLPYQADSQDALDDKLKSNRVLFIPSAYCLRDDLSDKVNLDEARIVADVLHRIHRFYGDHFDAQKTVGVIVPYRNQITVIRQEIEKYHLEALDNISIDTVERYQGSQRDVIIYSFTVQKPYQLDFLTSSSFMDEGKVIDRKLNVALTRARKQLIIIGNAELLKTNSVFRSLLEHIEKQSEKN